MDIETRRARAIGAVRAYMQSHPDYRDGEICEDAVTDLVADILHLCKAEDIDGERVLRAAAMHYEAEQ
ncbi:MAG: hypothetical protein ACLQF0_01435 [Dissulfurispiraceae bacterium]